LFIKSDSTRASNLELKIQSRITSELEKLAQQESSKLASSTEAASAEESGDEKQFNPFDRLTGAAAEQDKKAQLSHDSVSKEIEELRKKLTGRKRLEQIDPTVEKAREDLVQCLRINDRRPLDCWEQREAFKREVGRLEKEFVQRTIK
jgi:altered-inheritance-of-mitochondria protein 13